ncbi:Por secretion system C-terminal sorting domain-containing protein [Paludibacter jiangxiensis]|uniref:Por secretion system C-terminal sorting domain-containing protein n=1 Tax=Paludibacter jiangxiensis TaxID=681398 RepID=A0A161LFB8_9BACT|nr:Por secretion system C-terminal sorting domain-containing protein [Paludibacter jiangxiensis]
MKTLSAIFLYLLCISSIAGQVVTTNPVLVTKDAGVISVIFDAAQGSAGLKDDAGPIYAHTGVITNLSTSSSDWKHVITDWPTSTNQSSVNLAKNKLTSLGNNKWKLTITPDIYSYYGITDASETVTKLAFVFRNADGSKTGKNADGSDIFVSVYAASALTVKLATPTSNTLMPLNTASTITANSSASANMALYIGATSSSNITATTPVAQSNGVTTLSSSYTFTTPGNYYVIATATTSGGSTASDTSYVCVPKIQPLADRPSGLKEGLTKNPDGSVTFCLSLGKSAPVSAFTRVFILGDFNNYKLDNNYLMNLQADNTTYGTDVNFYWLTVSGLDASKEYAYQYYVDGLAGTNAVRVGDPYAEKILDPANDKYIGSSIYPNLKLYPSALTSGILSCFTINSSNYNWQYSSSFNPPLQSQLTIYEMLFRDFTSEKSVQAAISKLDYLKELGVNAVELMPIMEFDGNDSWGYNPNFYFATDKAYGTKADYQQFVDECHKRGIAVILDIVFNHTWGLSPYCLVYWDAANGRPAAANPYYNALAPHPYSVGNDINHTYAPVKAWLSRALKFWLTEYKVDGFRFDLSKGLTQTASNGGAVNPNATLNCSTYDQSRIDNIKTYVDAVKSTNPKAYAILEHFCDDAEENALAAYDSTMLWRNVSYAFQQAAMGYVDGSDFSRLASSSQSGGAVKLPTNRVAYAESHDEYRMGYKAITWGVTDVKDTTNVMKQLAVCGAFAFLSPGPRMMWEFGELGANYNSKGSNGSDNITSAFPAEWGFLNIPARKALHDNYQKILNLRLKYPSLFSNPTSWSWQVSASDWSAGRNVYLTDGKTSAVVLGNFTGTGAVSASAPFDKTGIWYELLTGDSINVTATPMTIALPEFGLKIYTNIRITPAPVDTATQKTVLIFPNPVEDMMYISGAPANSVQISDVNGRLVVVKDIENNRVNVSMLQTGMYLGKVFFRDGTTKAIKICKR